MTDYYLYPRRLCLLLLLACAMGTKAQSYLQVWFDSDKTIKEGAIPESGKLKSFVDVQHLSQGLHTIFMRVKSSDSEYAYSPVTSATFLKFDTSEGASALEYWFDDDLTNISSIEIDVKSDKEQVLMLNLLEKEDFPMGVHQLNMRVAVNGRQYSPIYSANFLRLRAGANNYICYWLDDDYDDRQHVWSKTGNGKDAYFNTRLDFSKVSPGMHRLHYRIASKDIDDGPVYEMPILVTRQYNNQTDVTIVNQSYWLNDAEAVSYAVANPKSLFTQTYNLDPANYEVGQYAFHVQYKNSAEVWSEQNVTYFYKEAETGRLRVGKMPTDPTAVTEVEQPDQVRCVYHNGTIYIDCLSAKLASTGTILVYDLAGKLIAREVVSNSDGIHAQVNVPGNTNQLLIVKLFSGNMHFTKKLIAR